MDISTARKILRVEKDAEIAEIKRRYRILAKKLHPDNIDTGNQKQFLIVNAAYLMLMGDIMGFADGNKKGDNDIEQAIKLKEEIAVYLDDLKEYYNSNRDAILRDTKNFVYKKIERAESTDEIKLVIEKEIPKKLTDMKVRVEFLLRGLVGKAKKDNKDFLFQLFKQMYIERRRYWFFTLYKNPIVIVDTIGLMFVYLLKEFLALKDEASWLFKLVHMWWLPVGIITIGIFCLLVQYIILNPKRQFVPPSFSLAEINSLVTQHAASVQASRGEMQFNLSFWLMLGGSIISLGVGTILGGILGWLLGTGAKEFAVIRDETKYKIAEEIEGMFNGLDSVVYQWIEDSKKEISTASFTAYKKNVRNFAGFLNDSYKDVRLLTK